MFTAIGISVRAWAFIDYMGNPVAESLTIRTIAKDCCHLPSVVITII
jgi:hypothetical protein